MALALPETSTIVGRFEFAVVLDDNGKLDVQYDAEDLSKEQTIGHLTTILDRLRDEMRYSWDTCPDCGRPWSEHDDDEEED